MLEKGHDEKTSACFTVNYTGDYLDASGNLTARD